LSNLTAYSVALEMVRGAASHFLFKSETHPIEDAVGRILTENLYSYESVPSFDNSAMDGFAVDWRLTSAATSTAPVTFAVQETIAAGHLCETELFDIIGKQKALEIMTGAPLPDDEGNLSVVKVEDVVCHRDDFGEVQRIEVSRPILELENVRRVGEDFAKDTLIAAAGTVLSPALLMGLSSLGISRVSVRAKPKVAVLATGAEIVDHGVSTLLRGKVRNSSSPYLMQSLRDLGADPHYYGILGDDCAEFTRVIREVLRDEPDVILSTGAVSMGKYDFVLRGLNDLGAEVHFHKVAIRPGKPIVFASFGKNTAFFGLPGNPISTSVGLRFFVEPFLRRLRGLPDEVPYQGYLSNETGKPRDLRCFFKARVSIDQGRLEVESLPGQASFMIHSLIEANAWCVLSESYSRINRGTLVDIYSLSPNYEHSWAAVGSHAQRTATSNAVGSRFSFHGVQGDCCK
jgi:molybdopterin molybdotransferase